MGMKRDAARKSPSGPKIAVWASSPKCAPTCSACPEARQTHQPVDGHPRDSSMIVS
jgi:hypothetical protein